MGSGDFTLTVEGFNFIPNSDGIPNSGSIVYFNNAPMILTQYVSSTKLTALIPALYVSKYGIYNIMVVNPSPGGGPSNPVAFNVIDVLTSDSSNNQNEGTVLETPSTDEITESINPALTPLPETKLTSEPKPVCNPKWQCTEWSVCIGSEQTRSCIDKNDCGITTDKPVTSQLCTLPLPKTETPKPTPEPKSELKNNSAQPSVFIPIKPIIVSISPVSGMVDTKVTITGQNFTDKDNSVTFSKGSTRSIFAGLTSTKNNTTLSFTIPMYSVPKCAYNKVPCLKHANVPINPGDYKISVTNSYGISNEIKFKVNPISKPASKNKPKLETNSNSNPNPNPNKK